MLTKEHLRLKVRGATVKIDFIKPDDLTLIGLADAVVHFLKSMSKSSLAEIEQAFVKRFKKDKVASGFFKLVLDRSGIKDVQDITSYRSELLSLSEALRVSGLSVFEDFQRAVAEHTGRSFEQVSGDIYGDLPQYRTLTEVAEVEASWLIDRFNLAQVQCSLLQCKKLNIRICSDSDTLRHVLKRARFHRLLVDVVDTADKEIELEVAGPGAVISGSVAYGVRLANFFPTVVGLGSRWKVTADLKYKGKDRVLKVDSTSGLKSDKGLIYSRVPEELEKFLLVFNGNGGDWQGHLGAELVRLGSDLCLPDFSFVHSDGRVKHMEIFHKGQNRQFIRRVEAAERNDLTNWLLAVPQPLTERAEIAERLQNSPWLQKYAMTFRSFPNTKGVADLLSRC